MLHRTLADFLEELGRAGELAPVDAEVDPRLEAAEITRRVARQGGPALLFRSVRGHDIPILTNLLGSESRICRALGVETIEEAGGRVDLLLNSSGGEGWFERLRFGSRAGAAASFAPNRVKSGACQQIVRLGSDIDLGELPFLQTGGEVTTPAISSATVLSVEPDSHAQVFLPCDLQLAGRDRLTAVWTDPAAAVPLIEEYASRQAGMPVAVVIGGDPAVQLAAAVPMPAAVDPLGLAGLLREKPLDAVACRSIDMAVPAEADFVLEGHLDSAGAATHASPRLSPTGRILAEQPGHAIQLTALTHRANRIFSFVVPGTIDGSEISLCQKVLARAFLPLLKLRIPELVDFDLPLSGGARHVAFLAIHKTYAGQARQAATAAWGMRPFCWARLLVIVDAEIDVGSADRVWAAIAHDAHPVRDVWLQAAPPDPLDPTSVAGEPAHRLAIDATRKLASEGSPSRTRSSPRDDEMEKQVTQRWAEYGLGPEEKGGKEETGNRGKQ